jgi:MFS transporter, NNP family, nitrate/nitrite transporter
VRRMLHCGHRFRFGVLLLIAATTGLGGGNFASSMANITHFYPVSKQGLPLGLNAAGGNLGTSVTQLAMPPLIVAFGLVAVGWVWMPLILLAAAGAYLFMNNLTKATSAYTAREMLTVWKRPQTSIMSVLYIGTFGSFIGYAFSFGVLIKSQFPDSKGANFIWLGALAGSLGRPIGGWLADRFGGARVTMIDFFLAEVNPADTEAVSTATARGRRDAAAAIGICSAVGAFGGVLIQQAFRISLEQTKSISPALTGLAVFYGVCVVLTWFCYLRRRVAVSAVPSLAGAGV